MRITTECHKTPMNYVLCICITHWESTSCVMYYVLRITYCVLRTATGSQHRLLCIVYYVLCVLCITHWESTSSIMYYVLRITYYVLRTGSPHRMLCIMYYVLCMMRHTLRISDKHTMCVCWLLRFMCSQRAHAHIMKIYSDSIHSSVDRDGNRGTYGSPSGSATKLQNMCEPVPMTRSRSRRGAPRAERAPKKILRVVEG